MVIWVGKAALTEMLIATFFMGYFYFVVKEDKASILLSSLCIWGFAFLHLTIYTMIPVVVLLYLGLFLMRRQKVYLYAGTGATVGFAMGIVLVRSVSTEYFYRNIPPLTGLLPFLSNENIYPILLWGSLAVAVAFLVWGILYGRIPSKPKKKIKVKKEKTKKVQKSKKEIWIFRAKEHKKIPREKIYLWGIRILILGCLAGTIAEMVRYGEERHAGVTIFIAAGVYE